MSNESTPKKLVGEISQGLPAIGRNLQVAAAWAKFGKRWEVVGTLSARSNGAGLRGVGL